MYSTVKVLIVVIIGIFSAVSCEDLCLNETQCKIYPSTCEEAYETDRRDGVFLIQVAFYPKPFFVQCYGRSVVMLYITEDIGIWRDFERAWDEAKHGFGGLGSFHFLGLEKIYSLMMENDYELRIEMRTKDGLKKRAYYSTFAIGNEDDYYAVRLLGPYSGNAGDSFSYAKGVPFTSWDRRIDGFPAPNRHPWWWHGNDTKAALLGKPGWENVYWKGLGDKTLTEAIMILVLKK